MGNIPPGGPTDPIAATNSKKIYTATQWYCQWIHGEVRKLNKPKPNKPYITIKWWKILQKNAEVKKKIRTSEKKSELKKKSKKISTSEKNLLKHL